jgi:AcrR family transcriptional regulator
MHQRNEAAAGFPPFAERATVHAIGGGFGMAIEERYDEILSAAREVIARRGFARASIREIARGAGLSLAGLYHYVGGKEELLFLVLDRSLDGLLAALDGALASAVTPEGRLHALVRTHLEFGFEQPAALKIINRDHELVGAAHRADVATKRQAYLRRGLAVLRELDPHDRPEDDLLSAVTLLLGMLNGIATRPFVRSGDDARVLAADVAALFLHGFLERAAGDTAGVPAGTPGGEHDA